VFCKRPLLVPRAKKGSESQNRTEPYSSIAEKKGHGGGDGDEVWRRNRPRTAAGKTKQQPAQARHHRKVERLQGTFHQERGREGGREREVPMVDMAGRRGREVGSRRGETGSAVLYSYSRKEKRSTNASPPLPSPCFFLLLLPHGVTVVFVCSGE
jgi:hypothetical protein